VQSKAGAPAYEIIGYAVIASTRKVGPIDLRMQLESIIKENQGCPKNGLRPRAQGNP